MKQRARSTPYAVLGMLSLAPMSGYDIRKEAATSIGYFWSESFGQIYPALKELTAQGLIRPRAGGKTGSRDRRVYEITERGREALRVWRSEPPREQAARNELLLKLFFGARESGGSEIEWIDGRLKEEMQRLREFERIREQIMKEQPDHPSLPFWLMTVSFGEHHVRTTIRWCRETLKALRSMERGAATRGAP